MAVDNATVKAESPRSVDPRSNSTNSGHVRNELCVACRGGHTKTKASTRQIKIAIAEKSEFHLKMLIKTLSEPKNKNIDESNQSLFIFSVLACFSSVHFIYQFSQSN